MQFLPKTPYPEHENAKLASLEKLFLEWHQHVAEKSSVPEKNEADEMVSDGFYPHYFSQKKRILFIGREARGIAGCSYIDILYPCYRDAKRVGDQHLNSSKFHSRMLRITHGIMNDLPEWRGIPYASTIGDTFGAPNGLSFAFMNISKFSNESENWQSDWAAINTFHGVSAHKRNFNREQIAILEPHIIITMNLGEKLNVLGELDLIHVSEDAKSFSLDINGQRSLLIDTWHFSAPRKSANAHYYNPICEAIRRSGL
jgi:hypothetical protein